MVRHPTPLTIRLTRSQKMATHSLKKFYSFDNHRASNFNLSTYYLKTSLYINGVVL